MPAGTTFLIAEGMVQDRIFNADIDKDGQYDYFYICLRNQFIHATHPLGWIRELKLKVNEKSISPDDMYFVLRNQWVCVRQMPTIQDIVWQMGEEAQLYVKQQGGLKPNSKCSIEITFVAATIEETRAIDFADKWEKRYQTIRVEAIVQE